MDFGAQEKGKGRRLTKTEQSQGCCIDVHDWCGTRSARVQLSICICIYVVLRRKKASQITQIGGCEWRRKTEALSMGYLC